MSIVSLISHQLREIWTNKCIDAGGTVRLDALDWMSKATLDAIGKAGQFSPTHSRLCAN